MRRPDLLVSTIKRSSIRTNLILSFIIITLTTLSSAIIAWYVLESNKKQIQHVTQKTLPLVSVAQNLSQEILVFNADSQEMSGVNDAEQLQDLMSTMQSRLVTIYRLIGRVEAFEIDNELISLIRIQLEEIEKKLLLKENFARQAIDYHDELGILLQSVRDNHNEFITVAEPKIATSYQRFRIKGEEVFGNMYEIIEGLEALDADRLREMEQSFRINYDTLLLAEGGEVRASLELYANLNLITGFYYQLETVRDLDRVQALQDAHTAVRQKINRIGLILGHATPEYRPLLLKAMKLVKFGNGDNSLFTLKAKEVDARKMVDHYNSATVSLSQVLSSKMATLVDESRAAAEESRQQLEIELGRGQVLQVIAAAVAIGITVAIGVFYLGRVVFLRLFSLQRTMEKHAIGDEVDIAVTGNDEITDMGRALQGFVEKRHEIEKELRNSLASLDDAQEIAHLGNCERDPKSLDWYWSDGFYKIIGHGADEMKATEDTFWSLVSGDDFDSVEKIFKDIEEQVGTTIEHEFRLRRKDGQLRVVRTRWRQSESMKEERFVQRGTFQDITDKKRIEEELLHSRKLESVGILAGGIAHDFNNLLTGILGNLSLAERFIDKDHQAKSCLDLTRKASIRARDLTAKLLTFADGGEPVRDVVDPALLLRESVDFSLVSTGINCTYEFAENLWSLNMDPAQANQVIQNLIINAEQAMQGEGELTIGCENYLASKNDIKNIKSGEYLKIDVCDNGPGIPKEHADKIFDPYFTTKSRDSTKGSGLGLAIVFSIVQKHGGIISASSNDGVGACFTLFLPAVSEKAIIAGEEEDIQYGQGTILVMDDEEIILDVAENALHHLGYTVLLAKDGQQAIEIYTDRRKNRQPVDVVIMDLMVPGGMGGVETLKRLLRDYPDIKAIVSSGYANDPIMQHYSEYGFIEVLSKPYNLNELSMKLAKAKDL